MYTLVTGGAGFIGSHLCELLLGQGHYVVAIDNLLSGRVANLSSFKDHPRFTFQECDITNRQVMQDHLANYRVDWLFHLAGMADIVPSIEQPELYFHHNVAGTLSVLEAARANKVKKVVYAASSSCYGLPDQFPTSEAAPVRPQYPYALTKRLGEELVMHWAQIYGLSAISLRLFNVYGPRSRTTGAYGAVFGVFLAQKLNGKAYTVVGDGQQSRDFTYVTDVAAAFLAAAESQQDGLILNVGSGDHYSINQLVTLLGGEVTYIPKRPGEPDCTFADTRAIREKLDWQPRISFQEGVRRMISHMDDWRDAPVWDRESIARATESWFRYLGDTHDA